MDAKTIGGLIHKVEGYCPINDGLILYTLARDLMAKGATVEIGSYKGRASICLAKGLQGKTDDKLYTIDADFFGVRAEFLKNIESAGVKDVVVPIFAHSAKANKNWDKPIKLLWIETDESYFAMKCNFILWERFLVPGGILAFPKSQRYVDNFMEDCIRPSGRFKDIQSTDYAIYARKSEEGKAYPRQYIEQIRKAYTYNYMIRKIYFSIARVISPRLTWKELKIKKLINKLFEKQLNL